MTTKAHDISLAVRGRIGDLVYQRVRKGKGNIETRGHYDLQLRTRGGWTDARKPAQLQGRARIAAATAEYQKLTAEQRAQWKTRANRTTRTGYNLFVADFCAAHPLTEF